MRFWNSDEMPLLKLGRDSSLSDCLPGSLSVWWLGCLWRCGLRKAMLMSFRRRGKGPSLMMASCCWRENKKKWHFSYIFIKNIFVESNVSVFQYVHLHSPRTGNVITRSLILWNIWGERTTRHFFLDAAFKILKLHIESQHGLVWLHNVSDVLCYQNVINWTLAIQFKL